MADSASSPMLPESERGLASSVTEWRRSIVPGTNPKNHVGWRLHHFAPHAANQLISS